MSVSLFRTNLLNPFFAAINILRVAFDRHADTQESLYISYPCYNVNSVGLCQEVLLQLSSMQFDTNSFSGSRDVRSGLDGQNDKYGKSFMRVFSMLTYRIQCLKLPFPLKGPSNSVALVV